MQMPQQKILGNVDQGCLTSLPAGRSNLTLLAYRDSCQSQAQGIWIGYLTPSGDTGVS